MTSNPVLELAVSNLIRVGVLASDATHETIEDLVVSEIRDLVGLQQFTALQTLSISGAACADYTPVGDLPLLHVLTLENSTVTRLDGLVAPRLRVANIRRNRVTDISALAHHAGLQVLDVSGNPLDEASVELAYQLRENGVVLFIDDAEVTQLNRDLAADHPDLVCYGSSGSCLLTVTGLDRDEPPQGVAVSVTVDQVRGMLGDDAAFASLIANRWGPAS